MSLFRRSATAVTLPDLAPGPAPVNSSPLRSGATGNAVTYTVTDYRQPDPTAEATIRSIETLFGAGQAGKLGQIHWGEKTSQAYRGDLGALQRFAGGQGVPRVATQDTIRTQSYENGLPGTSTVPGQPANQMLALLIATEPYMGAQAGASG